ncbi:MAG: methionine gamma-lyase family protein [Clostridia bacterium]
MIENRIREFVDSAECECKNLFTQIDKVAQFNQEKVLNAFTENRVALSHFSCSSGYGYEDTGKIKLKEVFSSVFKTEDAIVSPLLTCGTHALSTALFGVLRPNDLFISISGKPYDTLDDVISGEGNGSLKDFGVKFEIVELKNGKLDTENILKAITEKKPKLIMLQRSRGYDWREALSINDFEDIISKVRMIDKDVIVFVDNCYGEFVAEKEPSEVGADIVVGSLIKNPGGGIAPTGAYIVGRHKYITLIEGRLTAPSLGLEVGSYNASYSPYFEGFFIAPHVVSSSLKGMLLMGKAMEKLGYKTSPSSNILPKDIIRAVEFNSADEVIEFCKMIQSVSPVDSFLTPLPWDMPGYSSQVIMAAGAFIQGSSMELSCDSPIRAPYIAYMQGGLTYEHVKFAVMKACELLLK